MNGMKPMGIIAKPIARVPVIGLPPLFGGPKVKPAAPKTFVADDGITLPVPPPRVTKEPNINDAFSRSVWDWMDGMSDDAVLTLAKAFNEAGDREIRNFPTAGEGGRPPENKWIREQISNLLYLALDELRDMRIGGGNTAWSSLKGAFERLGAMYGLIEEFKKRMAARK